MKDIHVKETKYTPEIIYTAADNTMSIKGKSYPENADEFYAPVFEWLEKFFKEDNELHLTVNIELVYFNSSSSKALLNFLDMLEDAGDNDMKIVVNWIYDEEDDNMLEYGEEFKEDIDSIEFLLVPIESA